MEENKNVLFSQDDLIEEPKKEEPQSNVESGYTEELDFLQNAVQQAAEPVAPVEPEPVYEEAPVDTPVAQENTSVEKQEINENPMGKIKLNKEEEKTVEQVDPASIKLDIKGNKNLVYVVVLGILLLAIVFIIPMFVI